jgi:hypothetical protein
MKKYTFVVFTNAVKDRDDEFNSWYDDRHIPDVLAVPGFTAVQRFRLAETSPSQTFTHNYLALYEIETDDLAQVRRALSEVAGTDAMYISDSFDRTNALTRFFEPITERIAAHDDAAADRTDAVRLESRRRWPPVASRRSPPLRQTH